MGNEKLQLFFVFNSGDCDHLEPYPVYSETQHFNINLTSWNKPWAPEIDWLNSYINLSYYVHFALDALAVGYRTTKYAKYFYSADWGCYMAFPIDAELADAYYLEHFENTNDTKYICTPTVPMRPDIRRKMVETYPSGYASLIGCFVYKLGFFKELYKRSYFFSADYPTEKRIFSTTVSLLAFIGVFGEYP